jgi:magnesium chelatase family protein
MSLAKTLCRTLSGINAPLITVETHLANGLPAFNIVGLPEKAVQESRDRVRSAIQNSGFEFPARRITVNLAPADIPKQGSRFDLAIATGILAASEQIPSQGLDAFELLGELTLSGEVRPVKGVLPIALATHQAQHTLVLSPSNADEAGLVKKLTIFTVGHLLELCAHFSGQQPLEPISPGPQQTTSNTQLDLADVRGQAQAKRALEITATGRHNLFMMGPPGTGKSMLAKRLPSILPPMGENEALETATIHSIAGQTLNPTTWRQRVFRSPHHTCSGIALVGGGGAGNIRPGEASLAHNGVLFLDELPEFNNHVLDVLREPLETGHITISRAARSARFPSRFQMITASNPCKDGYYGDGSNRCRCTPEQVRKYQSRISGPLRDRIDIQIEVPAIPHHELIGQNQAQSESSAIVRERVNTAWQIQLARQGCSNAELAGPTLEKHCQLDKAQQQLLADAINKLGLSARAYHRILKVARSIADLANSEQLETPHLMEAIGYRRLDWR